MRLRHKILSMVAKGEYKPLDLHGLAAALGVLKSDFNRFKQEVGELHRGGRVVIGEDRTIRLTSQEGMMVGVYRANARGFGFVIPSDPAGVEDLYIPAEAASGALTGDLVQAKVSNRKVQGKMRLYGRIEKILARGKNKFIGTLFRSATHWMVQTDGKVLHQSIIVEDISAKQGRTGDRVVVQLTEYPSGEKLSRGVILEVLGPQGVGSVELQAVIREFDLPQEFPDSARANLEEIIERFNRTIGEDLAEGEVPKGRVDLRNKIIITIDPITARDFDDAISLDVLPDGGYELGVHIADVSTFVPLGSAVDTEARDRGNSVYLPRHVIPMIPEALSNGLCSLQEGQDRLTKSAFIRYDRKGNVQSSRSANSVIRSTQRLHYEQASAVLAGDYGKLPRPVVDLLLYAEKLARAIYTRREKAGMLHLDLPEVELEYNESGDFIDAHPADTSFSHTIIEMFMVEANEAVARLLDSYGIPFLRRVHPDPAPEAVEKLREFLTMLGHRIAKNADRTDLQDVIKSVAGKPESFAVSYALLRSLQRAEYSPKKVGHYALASTHYCHFTSPIRRYPDLDVHRLLELHFEGKLKQLAPSLRQDQQELVALGEHCSLTEERAQHAERQIKETLILQLMAEHIGDHYDGLVTGVCSLGPFIQLQRYLIEGLIPLEELGDDWWEVDKEGGFIYGRRSGRRIKIGDPLTVKVISVDMQSRRMNLGLVEEAGGRGKKGKKSEKGAKGGKGKKKASSGGRKGRGRRRR
ncbi:MAG: ribonuclease R [Phycisphaerae bacterium]